MNYGTIIDNILHPAPRAFMLRGAMVTNHKAAAKAAAEAQRRADEARAAWESALRAAQRLASTTQDITVIVSP